MTNPFSRIEPKIGFYLEELEQKNKKAPTDPASQIQWEINEPMSRHTTFRIGGSAALYAKCQTVEALAALTKHCRENEIPTIVLGNGSNVLFADEGFCGVVLSMSDLHTITIAENTIVAGAGANLSAVAKAARDHSLTGMEFAYGIPGSCGGAVFMNAGAYDGEMRDIVQESTYLDTTDGTLHTLHRDEHAFGYRDSAYRHHPGWILVSVKLALQPGDREAIGANMEDFWSRRTAKQPLDYPSAGSVFKRYPGRYTAQMIDEAGLKGAMVGGAQVSEKHAGFIINKGNATSADVVTLIEQIRQTLHDKYGIWIECELIRYPK